MASAKWVIDPKQSMAAALERQLSLEILRGIRTPNSNLPPVRSLATEFETTVPTMQRVVDRLEASGLVTVRRGSGVTVNDPHACGELSLLPLWLEALQDQPERMTEVLGDFLEVRRVMTAHIIRTRLKKIAQAADSLLEAANRLRLAESLEDAVQADLDFSRAAVCASGQFAVTALFHTSEVLVREVPHLAEALYGDRRYHLRHIKRIATLLAQSEDVDDTARQILDALAAWDQRTLTRFGKALALR